jgi:serine/threonine-protein kinase
MARRHVTALSVEPRGDRHLVRVDVRGTTISIGTLDGGIADAACARLALVADIDLGASNQRLGRAQVRIADEVVDLLIAVRPTPAGLGLAIHRIASGASATDDFGGEASSRYRLLDELGRGGMGVVYRAEHIVLQKPVAIKVLRPGLADDPVRTAQFVLEARAACRARHPGIVDVTDFGRFGDGRAFIVMGGVSCRRGSERRDFLQARRHGLRAGSHARKAEGENERCLGGDVDDSGDGQ